MSFGTRLCSLPWIAALYDDMQMESETIWARISSSFIGGSSNSSSLRSFLPYIRTAFVFMWLSLTFISSA